MTRLLTLVAFLCAGLALGGLELLARRDGSRIPRLGEVTGALLGYRLGRVPVGRILAYALWTWVGWHFFAR